MKDISVLKNIVVDRKKLAELIEASDAPELMQLLSVGDSQVRMMRKAERGPSANGLLRLMMRYNLQPEDLSIELAG